MAVVNASQHVALRVSDIERAARFYIEAFDGRYLTLPFEAEGPEMEGIFGGHPGLKVKVCILAFPQGVIELFQFVEPARPTGVDDPTRSTLMHWCVQVDDVEAMTEKVLSLGAKLVQPIGDWGGAKFVYCTDPDGNTFEMLGMPMTEVAELTFALFPDARPPAA